MYASSAAKRRERRGEKGGERKKHIHKYCTMTFLLLFTANCNSKNCQCNYTQVSARSDSLYVTRKKSQAK